MELRSRRWGRAVVLVVVLLAGLLTATPATATGRQTHTGVIDGAAFRVETPERWNGTLVLYSHAYFSDGLPIPPEVWLANRKETEHWLLANGYALAASDYQGRFGFAVEPALRDQIAVLDWFERNVGKPRRTVASGMSMGGGIAVLLAERNPRRISGVVATCADLDHLAPYNMSLDVTFAIRTLLAPGEDIDLVLADDPAASTQALLTAIERALATPEGRARLALAGAFANLPPWRHAHHAPPVELVERIKQQAAWAEGSASALGPAGRADLERRAGGNPAWNVGVDYGRQLARSSQRGLVEEAYRAAGLDLGADLARLAAEPRIFPDAWATGYMYRYAIPRGITPAPVLTLHNTADGGASTDQENWYAAQVAARGDQDRLRQLFSDRGNHCAFSGAEEIVSLRTMFTRVETGRWPDTSPGALNAEVAEFGPEYQVVTNFGDFADAVLGPSFVEHRPAGLQRASR
ncbi:alpha/beta hydrolase family protein [Amycolatopsis albispora]|uniref:alpha/beta hydrolase family protein n=1 Tax=Amycolatopsis albispora TaxID=1804986 RepID=UPI000DE3AF42|nr:alpha/beta fold hydrolase [Amycolatopsis albispora]